jgi:ABC-2 type transport system permease protein
MTAATYPIDQVLTSPTTTVARIVNAEWTKLRTLPSTWRTAVMSTVLAIGFSALAVAVQASGWHDATPQQRQMFDPTSASLTGLIIAAILLGALGVRTVTAEYSTGMVRTTFTAMPARRVVLGSKAATAAAFVFPITVLSNLACFTLGQRILAGKHIDVSIGHPGVVEAIFFGALGVSLVTVIGVGLAGVIRHTAGAVIALAMLIVGTFTLQELIPAGLRHYLPGTALQSAVTVHRSNGLLKPGTALVVLGIYAAVVLTASLMRVAHRDA